MKVKNTYSMSRGYQAISGIFSKTGLSLLALLLSLNVFAAAPDPITGPNRVCMGSIITLSDATPGGTWTSANAFIASVAMNTGAVTGRFKGAVIITYHTAGGTATYVVNVDPLFFISPTKATICQDQSIVMNNSTPGGGTWSSSNPGVATFSQLSASLITASGIAPGTTVFTFTSSAGCVNTRSVTVVPTAPVTGPTSVCAAQSIQLADAVAGGTWSSSQPTKLQVNAAGKVTAGISSSILVTSDVLIKYTLPTGCVTNHTVTVNPLYEITPFVAPVKICQDQSVTMGNQTLPAGGTWTTSNASVVNFTALTAGTMSATGIGAGNALISFTTTTGCITTRSVTVFPSASINGPTAVCPGQSIQLSNAVSGGTWTTSHPTIGIVDKTTGKVTGGIYTSVLSTIIVTIKYTTAAGCATTHTVSVSPMFPINPIVTRAVICENESITMKNSTPPLGAGTWTSSDAAIVTIDPINSTMMSATGLTPGNAVISYTTGDGCIATRSVVVVPRVSSAGSVEICAGQSIQLSNAIAGGTWSSPLPTKAKVDTTGKVTGGIYNGILEPTNVIIKYTLGTGCATSYSVTVNPLFPITPTVANAKICLNGSIIMNNSTPPLGGTWSSSNASVASFDLINSTMISASGLALGTTVITFETNEGCIATRTVTVIDCDTVAIGLNDPLTISSEIRLFPNPNNGTFTIEGDLGAQLSTGGNNMVTIEIMDLTGRVNYTKTVAAQGNKLHEQVTPGNNLANGTYLLRLRWADQQKVFHFMLQ